MAPRTPYQTLILVCCLVVVLLGIAVAVSVRGSIEPPRTRVTSATEHINPGAPKGPVGGDWFDSGYAGAENPSLSEVMRRARYPLLLRVEDGRLIEPIRILVQPQVFGPDEKVVEGFGFRYSDRIYITVDPSDKPLDIEAELSAEQAPNTKGEAVTLFKTEVRGATAVGREAGVQKWEYGTENRYSAFVRWSERGNAGAPYLVFTVTGDGPVDKLKTIAESLNVADAGP